ncbi:MAG TPA: hypothetical protein VFF03_09990 [Rhodocyclaceae bacterium]|nr:hypothetical protein [Rhodocyclaceae bacterium]
MKLDRFHTSKLLAVAVAALIPIGAAQATDLYDSLKTLGVSPDRDSRNARAQAELRDTSPAQNRGAQGPYYRSDMEADRPATSDQSGTTYGQPQYTPQPQYAPQQESIPTSNERSP